MSQSYLIVHNKSGNIAPSTKAHIWDGDDTLCHMYSTGGLVKDRCRNHDDIGNRMICNVCQNRAPEQTKKYNVGSESNKYKARPTEFKGVRYRSKSEACLAFAMDSYDNVMFRYEPVELKSNGYIPDFSLIANGERGFFQEVIEYKPSMPTETYMYELRLRFSDIKNMHADLILPNTSFLMIAASPWEPDEAKVMYLNDDGFENYDDYVDALMPRLISAKSHRFDLA